MPWPTSRLSILPKILLLFLILGLSAPLIAAPQQPQLDTFNQSIRPLLKERCFACHGALKQAANLRLDTAIAILLGGDSGPAVIPNQPENSPLLLRISATDLTTRMPPEGHAITSAQIETIKIWISNGAQKPILDLPEPTPSDHWAFQPITPPIITSPPNPASTLSNPIDLLLASELAKHNLTPHPIAEPTHRLRRLYLDLIGVPPSPQQLQDFLDDTSPDAYEKVATRLLDSPQYGERWARHWMDVWRYADWFGRRYVPDVWNSAPQIWHWRDWIVRSLNQDTGYDQMIREMLAADEFNPGDPSSAVATGFLIRNWYALNPNDWMRSNVEHTSKAFLGLTFQCAHCHDHKYDPISQEDYFRLRACFETIGIRQDQIPGQPDPGPFQEYEYSTLRKVQRLGIVSIYDKNPNAPTFFYTNGDERNRDSSHRPITPGVPSFLTEFFPSSIETLTLPPIAFYPGLNPDLQTALRNSCEQNIRQAEEKLVAAQAAYQTSLQSPTHQQAQNKLQLAEQKYLAENPPNPSAPDQQPLVGYHSLLLNALAGRRMIFRSLPEVLEPIELAQISFDVAILSQSHFNFQLTRDNTQGLTASFVGFEKGEIRAYQPQSFQEFVVATFDTSKTHNRFHVQLHIDIKKDECLLTIQSLPSGNDIVTNIPIALNQWNPHKDLTKGILFDARPGALAAIDNIALTTLSHQPDQSNQTLLLLDFEPPNFALNADIIPSDHWQSLSFSLPPADSRIVDSIPSINSLAHKKELDQLRRIASLHNLRLRSAEASLRSAQTELDSLLATIQADQQKYAQTSPHPLSTPNPNAAVQANQVQRLADLHSHEARLLTAELSLAECEAKSTDDPKRDAEIQTATNHWTQTLAATQKARASAQLPASENYQPLTRTYPNVSTGRRKALAQWITHPNNPLTARVAVNHIWMRHFHKPLVPSVFDFGRSSPSPKQLHLLNWLASELIQSNWSMKKIHYLIVTSQAFQRSSASLNPAALQIDPENDLYWRMNTGRMEAEVIRDSLLHIADSLDRQLGGQELENNTSFTTFRRSLYYCCQPEEDGKSPIGQLFDGPDPADCYRRTRTIIPQQALTLTNSPLVHNVADLLHNKIQNQLPKNDQPANYVRLAFQSILGRPPNHDELIHCIHFLAQTNSSASELTPTTAETSTRYPSLLRVLFNHNDFITIR
jgi:hypothetical protein